MDLIVGYGIHPSLSGAQVGSVGVTAPPRVHCASAVALSSAVGNSLCRYLAEGQPCPRGFHVLGGDRLAPRPRVRSSLARPVEAPRELPVHSPRHLGSEEPGLSLDLPEGPSLRQLLEVRANDLLNLRIRESDVLVPARRCTISRHGSARGGRRTASAAGVTAHPHVLLQRSSVTRPLTVDVTGIDEPRP